MPRLLPFCAGALALLPFVPALGAGFVNWDDTAMLLSQTGYRSLGARGLGWMLTSTVMGHWSPLAWLSFALDYSLGGLEPRVYHATNLALHALNAALVCVVARLLLRPVLCPRGGEAAVGAGALGAALLFAVHPLRAETVAWISDRRDHCAACLNNLARALMRRPDSGEPGAGVRTAEAEALLRRAIASRPDLPGPHRNLGALLVMGARWAEAEAVFAEVLRRWPTSADGPAGLAAARGGAGDTAGAVALLRLAVALDPAFGGARLELSRLERALEERRMPARPVR